MVRVVQFTYSAAAGGIEVWLRDALQHIDRRAIRVDFAVHRVDPEFARSLEELGARVVELPHPSRLVSYQRAIHNLMRTHGPYDVAHIHVRHRGLVALMATMERVPIRIMHYHSTSFAARSRARRLALRVVDRLGRRCATHGFGCSEPVARAGFGPDWREDPRWDVLYCGVDMSRFDAPAERAPLLKELGIPADARVVGHVGRFEPPKNHVFFIEVAAELLRRRRDVHFLLVGDGTLFSRLRQDIRERGLDSHVHLVGTRYDVPALMAGAMDLLLFPSLWEGLGLVCVEAQCAGLRTIASQAVPEEAVIFPEMVERLPLEQGPAQWADRVVNALDLPSPLDRETCLRGMKESRFNIVESAARLSELYLGASEK